MSAILSSKPIERLSDFAGILRDQEVFGSEEDTGFGNSINSWFDKLMLQSGMGVAPSMLLAMSLFLGVVGFGMTFIIQENMLTSLLVGAMGAVAPVITAVFVRQRRQKKMMQQLPAMIDELARAAKTGRSIEQCWELVSHDTPAPLGDELMDCNRRMKMGDDLSLALQALPHRTGIITLNILVTTLTVHQQTGGDLVSVLERLSQTIRDRLLFFGRLRAATVGARWTAIMMLALVPFIVVFFSLGDPEYFPKIMASSMGRMATITAIVFQMIGTGWILRILHNSQRN
ncbi:pilus assembly protein TadB [bacterium]|nr:pilus assembly protein TadB [bacterium]